MDEVVKTAKSESIAAVRAVTNPFPGLRPFGIEESHLFFGREGQSEEVLTKLSKNKFVAVIGASETQIITYLLRTCSYFVWRFYCIGWLTVEDYCLSTW